MNVCYQQENVKLMLLLMGSVFKCPTGSSDHKIILNRRDFQKSQNVHLTFIFISKYSVINIFVLKQMLIANKLNSRSHLSQFHAANLLGISNVLNM